MCGPISTLVLQAPAKVNLFLKVLGKRSDGFHEIETVMQSLCLHDTLEFKINDNSELNLQIQHASGNLTPTDTDIPVDSGNLIIKAAIALRQYTGCQQGIDILLRKRIPAQAGLGGGSSNAATTLLALNRLWQLDLSRSELMSIAADLGSDIPFFVSGNGLAVAEGRGEQLNSYPGTPLYFVIAKPSSGLSTAEVYANCEVSAFSHSAKDLLSALQKREMSCIQSMFYNSLQQPAQQLDVAVQQLLEIMESESFLATLMSGSGTSCFGLCRNQREAVRIARRLSSQHFGQVFVTRSRI